MFKLMIADDNPYALGELRDMVDWESLDLALIGAYPNGKELLDAAKAEIPDIVITDISMPVLNGIALTTALRELSADVKIVFLSNYSDFKYAQKAVQLHITDYLLKPFDAAQLVAVMKNLVQELCGERLARYESAQSHRQTEFYRNQAIENYAGKLLCQTEEDSLIRSHLAELDLHLPENLLLRVAHILLSVQPDANCAEHRNVIRSILQAHQSNHCTLILLSHRYAGFSVLLLYQNPEFDVENLLSQLHIDIETATGISSTIGFSSTVCEFSVLSELNAQAVIAATQKDSTRNVVISYGEIQTEGSKPPKKHSPAIISNYVLKMKEYIHANYMTPITTNDVSSSVFLSSSYANQCFSAECNCTIFDYITQCRISQAKKLLEKTDTKVSSVAELVGYNGKTSFYLAFKRNVGVSPTEYRSMHNASNE